MQEYFFRICSEEKKFFLQLQSSQSNLTESMEGSKIVDKLILYLPTFLVQSFHDIFNGTLKMSKI